MQLSGTVPMGSIPSTGKKHLLKKNLSLILKCILLMIAGFGWCTIKTNLWQFLPNLQTEFLIFSMIFPPNVWRPSQVPTRECCQTAKKMTCQKKNINRKILTLYILYMKSAFLQATSFLVNMVKQSPLKRCSKY